MSTVQLRRIALALVVLLALWGAAQLFSRGSDRLRGSLVVPRVPAETRDTFTIVKGRDTVRLVQSTAGVWTANGNPAAPAAGSELVSALDDTAPRELAAVSPTSFGRMGVDTGAWTLVVGPLAHPTVTLLVGATGPGYGTGYVRLAGSDSVYLWRGALPGLVRRPADDWRDHHIGGVMADSAEAIDVTGVGRGYALRRDRKRWLLDGAPADSSKVAILLAQLRTVDARGFATPAELDSLAHARHLARRTLTVRGTGARTLLALTLDSLSGAFWVTKPGDPTVYRLDLWQGAQLLPTAASLTAHH